MIVASDVGRSGRSRRTSSSSSTTAPRPAERARRRRRRGTTRGGAAGPPPHPVGVAGGLDHRDGGSGVGEQPRDLVDRGGLVDGHGHRAGEPDGVVHQGPLVAGPGQQGDPVARARHRTRPGPWRRRGPRARNSARGASPTLAGPRGQHGPVRVLAGVGDDVVGQGAGRRRLTWPSGWRTPASRASVATKSIGQVRHTLSTAREDSGRPLTRRSATLAATKKSTGTSEATWLSRPPRASSSPPTPPR